jgi:MbtH protein
MEETPVNPFDDKQGTFFVLANHEGQYSLWPTFATVPGGWTVKFGPAGYQACVDHVEQNWVDMRPNSLISAMEAR